MRTIRKYIRRASDLLTGLLATLALLGVILYALIFRKSFLRNVEKIGSTYTGAVQNLTTSGASKHPHDD